MIMHYLITLPYLALFAMFLPKNKRLQYPIFFIVALGLNLPLFQGLSLNDITFSFVGNLSFVLLAFCSLILLESTQNKKHQLITLKGLSLIILMNFLFFLTFLNIIPINLYYQSPKLTLIIALLITLGAYFIDKVLAIIYLLALFAYTIKLFDSPNILDYYFDLPSLIIAIITFIYLILKRK